ncbi:hypothetical protein [Methylotenera sp. G11]|uniref:hypothetical protein n=1 Tax=Methylotenera sp. G11 TaxID=1506585 RepID=UPI00136350CA|nr:hypothetical protein [Methylotenera sp. G11]
MQKWPESEMLARFKKKQHKLSTLLLKVIIDSHLFICLRLNKNQGSQFYFRKNWEALSNHPVVNFLLARLENHYQLSKPELLLGCITRRLRKFRIAYVPDVVFDHKQLINITSTNEVIILLTVHNEFALTTRVLSDLGCNVTTIAYVPEQIASGKFVRSGVKSAVNIINSDAYCLAKLSKVIHNPGVICCDVDFPDENGKCRYISPALFEFAHRFKLPLYFCKYKMLADGSICLEISERSDASSAEDCVDNFISFINASAAFKKDLSAKRYIFE